MKVGSERKMKIPKINQGVLDLTGKGLRSLKGIEVDPNLITLIIDDNHIKSFKSLKTQPNLTNISARNNPIQFLTGLCDQPSLNSLDITGTPISGPNVRNMEGRVLATVGDKLAILNGKRLDSSHQKLASIYLKKKNQDLFLPKEGEDDSSDVEDIDPVRIESLIEMQKFYLKETKGCFKEFAKNEALLYDLKRFGPMPVITPSTSNDDLIHAIVSLTKRNNLLKEVIDQMAPSKEEEDYDYD